MISRRATLLGAGGAALVSADLARSQDRTACPTTLTDGKPIVLSEGKPLTEDWCRRDPVTGQQYGHAVMSEAERAQGFIRPVRQVYTHLRCGKDTSMSRDIAETMARNPKFYNGTTFCVACRGYFPFEEFVWKGSAEKVGS